MPRLRALSSALLSFGLLLTAQSAVPPVAGATPEPGAGQTANPPPPRAAAQSWGCCRDILAGPGELPADAQCTTVAVPVDYANPGAAHANLAVIRV
ncbi:MAG: alpha/beta hydrolase, partial [Mycobacterium sp.]|nr:alpha/beta hydrolase [Mycobacterium sp.]